MANLKNVKKGDKVILRMFTGAFVEAKTVEMADAKKIGFTNKQGVKMVFDKATGKQIAPEPKSEKYANFLDEYDADVEAAEIAKKANRSKKKAAPAKATKPEEDDEDFEEADEVEDDEEEDEPEEAPAPKKKPVAKKKG